VGTTLRMAIPVLLSPLVARHLARLRPSPARTLAMAAYPLILFVVLAAVAAMSSGPLALS
jgi:hypothetical protein